VRTVFIQYDVNEIVEKLAALEENSLDPFVSIGSCNITYLDKAYVYHLVLKSHLLSQVHLNDSSMKKPKLEQSGRQEKLHDMKFVVDSL
jgi:hypothetical protein